MSSESVGLDAIVGPHMVPGTYNRPDRVVRFTVTPEGLEVAEECDEFFGATLTPTGLAHLVCFLQRRLNDMRQPGVDAYAIDQLSGCCTWPLVRSESFDDEGVRHSSAACGRCGQVKSVMMDVGALDLGVVHDSSGDAKPCMPIVCPPLQEFTWRDIRSPEEPA